MTTPRARALAPLFGLFATVVGCGTSGDAPAQPEEGVPDSLVRHDTADASSPPDDATDAGKSEVGTDGALPDSTTPPADTGPIPPVGPLAFDCRFDASKGGKDYHVGPGQAFARLSDVPFEKLGPGDMVRVEYTAAGYHEKVLISTRGADGNPIVLCGIPGPKGELPILDAQNAVSRLTAPYGTYHPIEEAGVVTVFNNRRYDTPKPGYIVIAGLDVRGAKKDVPFTDASGKASKFGFDSSAVYFFAVEHVVLQSNHIHDSGDGLFVASKDDEPSMSRDVLVQGNLIDDNGDPTTYLVHNIYTEASGIVFQFNHIGQCKAGTPGNALKDRSAGLVIRYNLIEAGGHVLDLVDAQDSATINRKEPDWHDTFVYGNVIVDQPPNTSSYLVHYGGDSYGDGPLPAGNAYRQGTLHFYDNTVLLQIDYADATRVTVFHLSTNGEKADVRNNVFALFPRTAGGTPTQLYFLDSNQADAPSGVLSLGKNWITSGYLTAHGTPLGTITGVASLVVGTGDPGFVDRKKLDLHLASGSTLIGAAGPLDATVLARAPKLDVLYELDGTTRPDVKSLSLGALH